MNELLHGLALALFAVAWIALLLELRWRYQDKEK